VFLATKAATKPRKQASQARSRATVNALIEATARILVDEGFDKASTNRIAEVAGVSVGSLYQYFPGKEALLVAVAERHNRAIMDVVGRVLDEIQSLPIKDAVRRLVVVAIEAHRIDPDLHRVLAEQIPRAGALKEIDMAISEAHAAFRDYLHDRRDELPVIDVARAAFVCATSIEALAHNAVLYRPDVLFDDAGQALIDDTTQLVTKFLGLD
jgi:AcrR family transcriptional regulator